MTAEREHQLLVTTIDVLRETGYEALTMDAVAARARCSKATLYRQWESKPRMVAAALYATRPVDISQINTGTLHGDLLAFVTRLADHGEKDTALVSGLAHVALNDATLAASIRETLFAPEHERMIALVERAVERGELPGTPAALRFVPQLLFTALLSRPLLEGVHADADYLRTFLDDVVLPVLRHP